MKIKIVKKYLTHCIVYCFRERMAHGFWQIDRMAIRNGEFFYWPAEIIVLL